MRRPVCIDISGIKRPITGAETLEEGRPAVEDIMMQQISFENCVVRFPDIQNLSNIPT